MGARRPYLSDGFEATEGSGLPVWAQYLTALAVIIVIAPLIAWLGRKHGRTIKGGSALALALLGFGAMFEPPKRAEIEARQELPEEEPGAGDPPRAP